MTGWARWGLVGTGAAWIALATVATVVRADEPPAQQPAEPAPATEAAQTKPAETKPAETKPAETKPADPAARPEPASGKQAVETADEPGSDTAGGEEDDGGEADEGEAAAVPQPADETEPAEGEGAGEAAGDEEVSEEASEGQGASPAEAPAAPSDDVAGGGRAALHAELFAAHGGTASDPKTWAGQEALTRRFGRHHTASPLIFPDQALPFRFSHSLHLAEGLECVDCHDTVKASVRSSDVNLPDEGTCFDCHEVNDAMEDPESADPPAECSTCHPGYIPDYPDDVEDFSKTHRARVAPPTPDIPPPNLKFNHKVHLDKGVQCTTCHGDLTKVDLATRDNALPTMGTCLTCHDGREAPSECRTCHLTTPDGRIDTHAAGEPLKPSGWYMADAHDDDWLRTHKHTARLDDGYCNNCHQPKQCLDCHNGVSKPLKIHPNNWILSHPVSARKGNPSCTSCHRQQTFCVDCHQQTKVSWEPVVGGVPQGKQSLAARGVRFHPDGWAAFPPNVGPQHHRFQAQRNINACAGCHTEETCLTCHNPGVYGAAAINPHAPGYGGSSLCRKQLQRNHRACVKCHQLGSAEIAMCR